MQERLVEVEICVDDAPRKPMLGLMRFMVGVALVALVFAGIASASRPATRGEMRWMDGAPINTGNGSFVVWALVSTENPHYAVYFAGRCPKTGCGMGHGTGAEVFLLRRAKLTERGWVGSLVAQAQLRPAVRPDILRVCRSAPAAVRKDLLAAVCR
jgi:hypothetical protein